MGKKSKRTVDANVTIPENEMLDPLAAEGDDADTTNEVSAVETSSPELIEVAPNENTVVADVIEGASALNDESVVLDEQPTIEAASDAPAPDTEAPVIAEPEPIPGELEPEPPEPKVNLWVLSQTFQPANAYLGSALQELAEMENMVEKPRQQAIAKMYHSMMSALSLCKDGEFAGIMEGIMAIFAKYGKGNLSERRLTAGLLAAGHLNNDNIRELNVLLRIIAATCNRNTRREAIATLSWGPLLEGLSRSKSGSKIAERLKRFYGV